MDKAFSLFQSLIGAAFFVTITGAVTSLPTWNEVGMLFAAFTVILYISIEWFGK